ncbi:MAG: hypothetical protein ACYTGB_06450, partial [Planctomycetota bacterium]
MTRNPEIPRATTGIAALLLLAGACAVRDDRPVPGRPVVPREARSRKTFPVEFRPVIGEPVRECYSGALLASDGRVYFAFSAKPRPARLAVCDPKTGKITIAAVFTSGALQGGPDGKKLPAGVEPVLKDEEAAGMPADQAWLYGQDKIHARLYEGADGRIYGATDSGVGSEHVDNTRRYAGGHFFAYDPRSGKVEDLGWARRHEGVIAVCMDPKRKILYGLTWPSGQLYACHLEKPEKGPRNKYLGLASSGVQGVPRYIEILKDGRVILCDGHNGDVLVYVPKDYDGPGAADVRAGRLYQPTGLRTPHRPERKDVPHFRSSWRYRNWWFQGARSPDGLRVYSSPQRRGQLFQFDASDSVFGRVIDHPHVKPWSGFGEEWRGAMVNVMNFGRNGLLYYVASGNLLSYDPKSGEVRDWGFMVDRTKPDRAISKTGCGVTSVAPDGTMYFTAAWSRPAG